MSDALFSDQIALNFLALRQQDFSFRIYRRALSSTETALPNTYSLPTHASGAGPHEDFRRYSVSLLPLSGYDPVSVGAWLNPWLTLWVLHDALQRRCASDLQAETEMIQDDFRREIAFVLKRHGAGVREVVWVRPYELKAIGRLGVLLKFSLRVPPDAGISDKQRLELSLAQKNGRPNEDFYLDQFGKIEQFLRRFYPAVESLDLYDGTTVNIERKLSVLRCWSLDRRVYRFANNAEGSSQFFGLRDQGPVQKAGDSVRLVFLFHPHDRPISQDLFRALRGDTYPTFPGMGQMFGMKLDRHNVSGLSVESFSKTDILAAAERLKSEYADEQIIPIALVPMTKHSSVAESDAYFNAKHAFLSVGLATQFVDRKRVQDRTALKWSLSNIGLAIFAKMGGVPWTLKPSTQKCLVVGIGQAHRIGADGQIERYFAYSVLADSSGVYESIRVLGSSTNPEQYRADLAHNLRDVLLAHRDRYSSFVLHLTFSMKKREMEIIKRLLTELHGEMRDGEEFIALKFNDHNDFMGFATAHNSRIPSEGAVLPLSRKEFLLWFSGLSMDDSKAPKKPEKPVHVQVLYPNEPLQHERLKRVMQDAMNLAGANWRGFNAKSLPISIYYAKLIAGYYAHFRELKLPDLNLDELSPWFL